MSLSCTFGSCSSNLPKGMIAAALAIRSRGPRSLSTCSTSAWTASVSVTSTTNGWMVALDSAVSFIPSSLTSSIATLAPCFANNWAAVRPMPLPPPVMSATLPLNAMAKSPLSVDQALKLVKSGPRRRLCPPSTPIHCPVIQRDSGPTRNRAR